MCPEVAPSRLPFAPKTEPIITVRTEPIPAPVRTEPIPAPVRTELVEVPDEDEIEINATPLKLDTPESKWAKAVESLREISPRHGKSLSHARFLGASAQGVRVWFPPDAAFHRSQIIGMSRAMVEVELAKVFGANTKLIEETQTPAQVQAAPASIAEVEQVSRSSREKAIELKIKQHPAVLNILRYLGGTIEHISYLDPPEKKTKVLTNEDGEMPPVADVGSSD